MHAADAPAAAGPDAADPGWPCLDGLPRLQALAQGPDGAEILDELARLVARRPVRAPRFRRDLLARIQSSDGLVQEAAVVRDISATGVRLRIPASAALDLVQLRHVNLQVRLPGSAFVTVAAALVRVVEHRDDVVELAFSLLASGPDPAFDALLGRLSDADPGAPADAPTQEAQG